MMQRAARSISLQFVGFTQVMMLEQQRLRRPIMIVERLFSRILTKLWCERRQFKGYSGKLREKTSSLPFQILKVRGCEMVILCSRASCSPKPQMMGLLTLCLYFYQQGEFSPRISLFPSISFQSRSTVLSQVSSSFQSLCRIFRLHQLFLSAGWYLLLKGVRLKVGDRSVVSVRIETAQQKSVWQLSISLFSYRLLQYSMSLLITEKSVFWMYSKKVLTLRRAYSFHFNPGCLMFLNLSQPSIVNPIAYMSMVVDCMRVEPASAIQPTLQLIFMIFYDWMNSRDLYTFSMRISSVLPQRMQGFRLESQVAFQTAPITQDVSPPSVLPIRRSFSWKPSSTRCCCANSGWSSKSSTDLMRAASPPAINATTFSLHSGRISLVSCLQRVSSTMDSLPVAPHPHTKILPPVFKVSLTASAMASNSSIFVSKMLIVSASNPFITSIACLTSEWASCESPRVLGLGCSVSKQPSLNLCENERKSSAVQPSLVISLQYIQLRHKSQVIREQQLACLKVQGVLAQNVAVLSEEVVQSGAVFEDFFDDFFFVRVFDVPVVVHSMLVLQQQRCIEMDEALML